MARAWAGIVPGAVAKLGICAWVCAAGFTEYGLDHIVKVVVCVGVVETLGEAVDVDAGVGRRDANLRIGAVIVLDWEEDEAGGGFGIVGRDFGGIVVVGVILDEVVANDRMDLYSAQEAASCFDNPEKEDSKRDADGGVDTVLDAREDGDDDPSEKDDNFQRRYSPELVHGIGRRDEIADCMDNDSCETRAWDVEEHRRQGIDGQEYNNASDDPSEGSSYTSL